jgi:hypothetical protein
LGDSKVSYQHSKETPIHGTGQGSCASPAILLFVSSVLMTILQKNAFGMEIADVKYYKAKLHQLIEACVDDTSIFTNDKNNNINKLKQTLQHDGTWWAGLLESSGGKPELQKCFYYILIWKWSKNVDPVPELIADQTKSSGDIKISLNEYTGEKVYLEQKEAYDSHKTLGTMKSIIGDEGNHIKFLKEKSKKLGELTKASQFNRRQSRKA